MKYHKLKFGIANVGIILFLFIFIYPLLIVFSGGLRGLRDSTSPLLLFQSFNLESLKAAWDKMNYFQSFFNSMFLTVIAVFLVVAVGGMAAYPLARLNTKLSAVISAIFLAGLVIPGQMAVTPVFKVMRALNVTNGQLSSIIMFVTCSMPFTTFLYSQFINGSVPWELEEAAMIDGIKDFGRYWKIVFPLLKPATASVIITQGIWIWNDYLYPMVFISKNAMKPLPQVMLTFLGDRENPTQWNLLFAACTLCVIPLVIVFIFLQKYFMNDLTTGGVKG